jgi:hypothetical protein
MFVQKVSGELREMFLTVSEDKIKDMIGYEEILEHEDYIKMNCFILKESERIKKENRCEYQLKLEKTKDYELNCSG